MGNFDVLTDLARNLAHQNPEHRPGKQPQVEQAPGRLDPVGVDLPLETDDEMAETAETDGETVLEESERESGAE